ncbi:set 5 [Fusarium phyllophilum]|uniref:Set 5 n=1 Tax=Fusarium phyllophilum TaxID=47803 RepID=A0A8H5KCQ3_9HYPO|nr:set 5 [Fusarium phyllophilum]
MGDNTSQPPDEPVLGPTLASSSIEDIPTLDLLVKLELDRGSDGTKPCDDKETEITEAHPEKDILSGSIADDAHLPHSDETPQNHEQGLFDDIATEYGDTSGSEPDFSSSSEFDFGSDDENEETTEDLIRYVTAHRDEPFEYVYRFPPVKPLEPIESPELTAMEPAGLPLTPSATTDVLFRNEFFVVRRSFIAGWGAFAVKDLEVGDKILVERPLFTADNNTLYKEFDKLDEASQDIALGLHANSYCKFQSIKAVWTTNCFSTGVWDEAGLFPVASRFNHTCHPRQTVEYHYNKADEVLEMEVKATIIREGEELTISYGCGLTPADLFYRYGFRCRCGGCSGWTEEDERGTW